jgi:hypothetical protein
LMFLMFEVPIRSTFGLPCCWFNLSLGCTGLPGCSNAQSD